MTVVQEVSPPSPIPKPRAMATSAIDLDRKIRHELAHSTFLDVPSLLESVFTGQHIDQAVTQIYSDLVLNKVYKEPRKRTEGSWVGLPRKPASESVLYTPLVEVLNAIAKRVQDPRMPLIWVDRHKNTIQSDFQDRLMPDVVALCLPQGTNVKEYLSQFDEEPRYEVWWRLVHTPLEVKVTKDRGGGGGKPAILQLFKYGRQTLKEQPDRRFVFALLFTTRKLGFWLLDRSGALGAETFDIHMEPTKLIRIIVGLMLKSPSELGWDPTMLQYISDKERKPSYEISRTFKSRFHVAYERKWFVTTPKPEPEPAALKHKPDPERASGAESKVETEDFVLFRAVSLSHAEVIKGRSTRIWLAWLGSEMTLEEEERTVFVFKDCWRDARRPHEGKLYEIGCRGENGTSIDTEGVAKVHSYSVVHVDGQEDNTLTLVRKGIMPKNKPLRLYDNLDWVDSYWAAGPDPSAVPERHKEAVRQFFIESNLPKDNLDTPRNRVHSRLVLSSFGWPLFKFKSLLELFSALRDVVSGHKHLCQRGVLHRDISPGNILITGRESPKCGILIDLDYGIEIPRKGHPLVDDELTGTIHFMSPELVTGKPYEIPASNVPTKTTQNTTTFHSGLIVPEKVEDLPPEIQADYEVDDEEDSVQPSSPVPVAKKDGRVPHADHHDLESLFWTLCYICIAREGPGKARVTWPDDEDQYGAVLDTLELYFYEEGPLKIANLKTDLMKDPRAFQQKIIDCFAPYFEHCKKEVKWLYDILRGAYSIRKFEGLHNAFIYCFERAMRRRKIREWHTVNEEYLKMEEEEEKRRTEDKKGKCNSPHKIDTKGLSKLQSRGKRALEDPEERQEGESLTSGSQASSYQPRTKRQKRGSPDDADPPSSLTARIVMTRSRTTTTQPSSTTQGHYLRSKTRTSSQNLATKDTRRTRKR